MLRFRNRFKGAPSTHHVCRCGGQLSHSIDAAQETLIHQLPWCAEFRALMEQCQAEPGVQLHHALFSPELRQTIVISDGESIADVERAP